MENFESLGFTSRIENDKIIIELSIDGLVNGFDDNPNGVGNTVKKSKKKEFAEYIAQTLIEECSSDIETGNSYIMDIFDRVFTTIDADLDFDFIEYNDADNNYFDEEYD